MAYHLPALLAFLAASPALGIDDADPLAIFDHATRAVWLSEVRRDETGTGLACRLHLMPMPDDSRHDMVEVILTAARSLWSIDACTIGGSQVSADPEAVMAVLAAARHQIRVGLVPEFDRLLLDHTGLSLPVVQHYAAKGGLSPA